MPPLLYPLPTTTLLTFSNVFTDPSRSHTTALADATAARTSLQLSLRAVANQEPGNSALAVVDAVQGYLPYLRGIMVCLDADDLIFKADPSFPWRPSLTYYTSSAPLIPLAGIHAEHLFVLLTYTLALANYAHAVLEALPVVSVSMSSDEEKRMAAGLARGVELLCQAAGMAEWTAENVCPMVDHVRTVTSRLGRHKWPVEVSGETFRGLSMTLLADAHLTAIRKLVLPVLSHILFAPAGPPLPPKHPSPSLLSKLYLHVANCYSSARALLKVSQEATRKLLKDEPEPVEGEIIAPVKRYLRKESNLATALGYKWLGIDAGENGKGEKVGEALAWTKEAQSRLGEMEDSKMREKMKGLGIGKNNERRKEERKARKGRVDLEVEDIAAWVKAYSRMNDTVAFQPIPPISTLSVPAGRPIFGVKPFKPPASKFGPPLRSDEEENGDKVDEYAGKGNYF